MKKIEAALISSVLVFVLFTGIIRASKHVTGDAPAENVPLFAVLGIQFAQLDRGIDMNYVVKNIGCSAATGNVWVPKRKLLYHMSLEGVPLNGNITEALFPLDVNGDGDTLDTFTANYINNTQIQINGVIANSMSKQQIRWYEPYGLYYVWEENSFQLGVKSHVIYNVWGSETEGRGYVLFGFDSPFVICQSPSIMLIVRQNSSSIDDVPKAEITELKVNKTLVPCQLNWSSAYFDDKIGQWYAENIYVFPIGPLDNYASADIEFSITGEPGSYTLYTDFIWSPDTFHLYRYMIFGLGEIPFIIPSGRVWDVDDDEPADFHTIQEAIDAVNVGDKIYVHTGTYYEHLMVYKPVALQGENKETTIIDGMTNGTIINVTATSVILRDFTIRNSGNRSLFNQTSPDVGILIQGDEYNPKISVVDVEDCTVLNNGIGIMSISSDAIQINDCTVTNNVFGVLLMGSSYATMKNNTLADNTYNFGVFPREDKPFLKGSINYIDASNTVNGKPIYYWVDQHNREAPSDAGYVAVAYSTNITVKDLTLSNNFQGILFANAACSLIENVVISDNGIGIHFSGNLGYLNASLGNIISRNLITKNFVGIYFIDGSNNTIIGNTITSNYGDSIWLFDSENNSIVGNAISNNSRGIYFDESSTNNYVVNNNLSNNNKGIIVGYYSGACTIHHNNFIDNTEQVVIEPWSYAGESIWDAGYPSGGNYWSDHNGTDLCGGSFQNETGSDGIGDTPYVIDGNNVDNYPLAGPFKCFSTSLGISCDAVSNSTIEDFQFFATNRTIIMHVSNATADQTYGFCRLTIPHDLVAPPYNITVNNNPTGYNTIFENETVSIIYFTYEHSTLEIIIIPELPSTVTLALLMTLSTFIIALAKKNSRPKQFPSNKNQ